MCVKTRHTDCIRPQTLSIPNCVIAICVKTSYLKQRYETNSPCSQLGNCDMQQTPSIPNCVTAMYVKLGFGSKWGMLGIDVQQKSKTRWFGAPKEDILLLIAPACSS